MAEKRMLFLINPKAGKAHIKNQLLAIIDIFIKDGYEVTVHITQSKGDAQRVVEEREDIYDILVCSGGDGTLDEVVTGMVKSGHSVPIGYIPAGSTNDFANSLKIPKNMQKAAQAVVNGEAFQCDIGAFNRDVFVYVAAFGMFTDVSYGTEQEMKNMLGHMAYILEGMKRLATVKSYKMRFMYEDTVIEGDFLFGMVTNSVSVGGFKRITGKNVELNDGELEVTLVRRPANVADLNRLIASLVDRSMENELIYWFKTARLQVESEENVAWTLDGEFGGEHKEVVIEDYKQAMCIMVPSKK
ncbi:MAG: diacylglycerol kinase family lipid kinase [Lachnospiraceae bacterium]|nr:diacylglycerol kinase family lipid kinase [Lachnospiraceae bacterium]